MEFHERPEEDARKPINAWSETITESGKFRAALAERRCVVPGPAYYEWLARRPGRKKPFAVARVGGDPVAFRDILEASRSSDAEVRHTAAPITTGAHRRLAGDPAPHAGDHGTGELAAVAERHRVRPQHFAASRPERPVMGLNGSSEVRRSLKERQKGVHAKRAGHRERFARATSGELGR
jgi:hypothetical protein